jgi:hypothetical protein
MILFFCCFRDNFSHFTITESPALTAPKDYGENVKNQKELAMVLNIHA